MKLFVLDILYVLQLHDRDIAFPQVMKRYKLFLEWLGIPAHLHGDYKAHHTCRILSEFSLEFRTTRDRVVQTMQKKKAAREKRKREKAEAEALAIAKTQLRSTARGGDSEVRGGDSGGGGGGGSKRRLSRRPREVTEDAQLRALLGAGAADLEVTDNGTLRRKKRHHHHRHHHRESRVVEGEVIQGGGVGEGDSLQKELESRRERREKKSSSSRRHRRSSLLDATPVPLTEEALLSLAGGSDMERGLLETLMAAPDQSTLKRNKERRRSIKERRSGNCN